MATYEELIKQGAVPVESQNQGSFSYDELIQQGATPVNPEDQFNQAQSGLAHSQNLLDKVTGVVTSIFPGGQVGEAIGTLGGYGVTKAQEALGQVPKGTSEAYSLEAPSPLQVSGDIARGAALVGGLKMPLPTAKGVGGAMLKTGLQTGGLAALAGGGEAATNKLAWKDVAKSAFYSGLTGAIGGAVIGGVTKGIENINQPEKIYNNALKVTQRIKSAGKSPSQFLADEGIWGNLGTFKKAADEGIATESQQIANAVENAPGGTDWSNIKAKATENLMRRFSEIYSPEEISKMIDNVPVASLQNTFSNIPEELKPLATEVNKYKSAEEFVGAQGKSFDEITNLGNDVPKKYGDSLFVREKVNLNDLSQTDYFDTGEYKQPYFKSMFSDVSKGKELPPIVVDKNGSVIDGNHRLEAYLKGGKDYQYIYKEVPQTKSQLTDFYNQVTKNLEIPWKTVNTARMQLGQLIGDTKWLQTNPTESTRATKAVYGALSDAVKGATGTAENFARESKWIQTRKVVGRAMDIADSKYGLGLYDKISIGAGAITGALSGEGGIEKRIKNAAIGGLTGLAIERGAGSSALKTGVAQLAKKLPVEALGRLGRTAINTISSKISGASDTDATQ